MTVDIKAKRNQLRDAGICTNTALTQGFGQYAVLFVMYRFVVQL